MCVDFKLVHIFVSRLTTDTFWGSNNQQFNLVLGFRKQRLEKTEKSH